MYMVWDLMDLLRATKASNLSLHVASLQKMIQLLFSYDHHTSVSYSAVYLKTMLNLPTTHPGAETLLPEKLIHREQVLSSWLKICWGRNNNWTNDQQHAKSQGGIICVDRNMSSWYATKHARGLHHQAALGRTDMDDHDSSAHKDLRSSNNHPEWRRHCQSDASSAELRKFLWSWEQEWTLLLVLWNPGTQRILEWSTWCWQDWTISVHAVCQKAIAGKKSELQQSYQETEIEDIYKDSKNSQSGKQVKED
jgi:hypothetical protein